MTIPKLLRKAIGKLRYSQMPPDVLITLLQQAADALDATQQERKPHTEADVQEILDAAYRGPFDLLAPTVRRILEVPAQKETP